MISDEYKKEAARTALEEEITRCGLSFTWSDTNADLAVKINTDRGL